MAHLHPASSAPHRALAHAAHREQRFDAIARHARDAVHRANGPDREEALAEMSWLLGQAQRSAEVVDLVEPFVDSMFHPHSFLNLAQAYVDLNRNADARALLENAREKLPPEFLPVIEMKLRDLQ